MITFDPSVPVWLLMLLFIPATIFLIWKEWQRKLRFRTLRLVAVLVMMLMLAAIFLRPYNNLTKSDRILLMTSGYDKGEVDSLIASQPDLRIMHIAGTEAPKGSLSLTSYFEVRDLEKNIRFIAGEGLPLHALALLHKKHFTFLPGEAPSGIVELSSRKQVIVNRKSTLTGTFRNGADKSSIFLVGPGGKEDSVSITTKGIASFDLSFTPRQTGKQLYSIVIQDTDGNNHRENYPIVVDEFSPIKVLVILSYPTFETTFLKNFIGSKGNSVVLRSQLSRNNFGYEYVNHQTIKFSSLTKNLLEEFDLLIADQASLQGLSNQEATTLKQSIHTGLGLLALYTRAPKEKTRTNFFPFRTVSSKEDTATLVGASKRYTLPVVPFRVMDETPLQTVLKHNSGILSGYTLSGKGKIGFQLLEQSYRLMLAGDTIDYGNLWSPLLERIARSRDLSTSIELTDRFPHYVDEPLHLKLISTIVSPSLLADSIRIPLREDVMLDDVWHATIWPETAGWHTLQVDGNTFDYYVSQANEWRSIALENQMNENYGSSDQSNIPTEVSEQRPVPPILFYSLLLLSAGFLWLAPKL